MFGEIIMFSRKYKPKFSDIRRGDEVIYKEHSGEQKTGTATGFRTDSHVWQVRRPDGLSVYVGKKNFVRVVKV